MRWFRARSGPSPRSLLPGLCEHFQAAPDRFPIVSQRFEASEHPNLQGGIDAYLSAEGRSATVLGLITPRVFRDVRLAELIAPRRGKSAGDFAPVEGPVEYVNVDLADDQVMPCVNVGLYLIRNGSQRLAALVSGPDDSRPFHKSISVRGYGSPARDRRPLPLRRARQHACSQCLSRQDSFARSSPVVGRRGGHQFS